MVTMREKLIMPIIQQNVKDWNTSPENQE
jgi:hypothetical protein